MSEALAGAKYVSWAEIDRDLSSEELGKAIAQLMSDDLPIRIKEAPAWNAGHEGMPSDRDVWAYVYDYQSEEDVSLLRGRYGTGFREFQPAGTKGSLTIRVFAWVDTEEQPALGIEAVRACIASMPPLVDECSDEIVHMAEDWLHREALRAVVAGHPDAQAIAAAALESRKVEFTRYYS